jgi:manganese transport protein
MGYPHKPHPRETQVLSKHFGEAEARSLEGWKQRGGYRALEQALGGGIATVFAVGLLASGLASTSVGAYAGAEIMHGLLHVRVPILARRLVTLIPALVILGAGIDPTWALVLSQVELSFGIPFALIPLVWVTGQRRVMAGYVNRWYTTAAGAVCAVLLVALNLLLVLLLFTEP